MTRTRLVRSAAALTLAGSLALAAAVAIVGPIGGTPAAQAAAAADCLAPRADSPSGATFTITSDTVASGGTITFTGTGFQRTQTDGLGQTLSFKLNDQAQWATTVKAADDGTVSDSLSLAELPAADVAELGAQACGTYWVRVLVGSAAAGDMAPNRSVHATFQLAASGPTPTPGATAAPDATPTPIAESGGTLPQTGIEETPPVVWIGGFALLAAVALVAERLIRRRRAHA